MLKKLLPAALAAMSLLGCAQEANFESAPDNVATTRQAVGQCAYEEYGYWYSKNGTHVQLMHTSEGFCWMTRAGGRFDGDKGNTVGVSVLPEADGYWYLTTRATDEWGEAHCVPLSCFSADGEDDEVWFSTNNISTLASASSNACDTDTNSTGPWWGDAATLLQAWPGANGPGNTAGGGEKVDVFQSTDPYVASTIESKDCQYGDSGKWIRAHATSLFVGTPYNGVAAHFANTFYVQNNFTLPLSVYADEAICYFTHIHGKFRGGGEYVRLYLEPQPGGRHKWVVRSNKGGDGASIRADGRCFWFSQWDL